MKGETRKCTGLPTPLEHVQTSLPGDHVGSRKWWCYALNNNKTVYMDQLERGDLIPIYLCEFFEKSWSINRVVFGWFEPNLFIFANNARYLNSLEKSYSHSLTITSTNIKVTHMWPEINKTHEMNCTARSPSLRLHTFYNLKLLDKRQL